MKHIQVEQVYENCPVLLAILKGDLHCGKGVDSMSDDDRAKVTLRLPSTLSAYSGGKSQIQLQANSVEQLLVALAQEHPRVWEHLCNEQGHLREHVKMFVSNELITGSNGLQTPLKSGQEIIVLPVISGL